jgi:hypothetical protein
MDMQVYMKLGQVVGIAGSYKQKYEVAHDLFYSFFHEEYGTCWSFDPEYINVTQLEPADLDILFKVLAASSSRS